ncbi:translation initiation factor IF-3 [Candidatus Dependentiae bacterium]|nr:translation initiation factor IF-3 [Candidatus Dependentiae bacterium]
MEVINISKFIKKQDRNFKKTDLFRINSRIMSPNVRLISETGEQKGVVSLSDAIRMAENVELDLVEISPNANPPVCKILDYGKFLFEKKKKLKESKKKQKVSQLKEIKLTPKISEHDIEHKRGHIIKFLNEGDKVKISMRFRGRERMYSERGIELMKNFFSTLSELAEIEQELKMDGSTLSMCIAPKKQSTKPVIKSSKSEKISVKKMDIEQNEDEDISDENNLEIDDDISEEIDEIDEVEEIDEDEIDETEDNE